MWEKAIELCKQLAKMHESHMFDFMELSQLLVREHELRDSDVIAYKTSERLRTMNCCENSWSLIWIVLFFHLFRYLTLSICWSHWI